MKHRSRSSSLKTYQFQKTMVTSTLATPLNSEVFSTSATSLNTNLNDIPGKYQSSVTSINITWDGSKSLNSLNFTMSSSRMTSGNYFAFGLSQVKINKISLFYFILKFKVMLSLNLNSSITLLQYVFC